MGPSAVLAAIPYPRVDPVAFRVLGFDVRWYGIAYVVAFGLAAWVLRGLALRKRWPVAPERVVDVLFWGILGVWVGGRTGHVLFYEGGDLSRWFEFRKGGMAFHGGLLGVVLAYWLYARSKRLRFRDLADGLAVATGPGIVVVRLANFVNAELKGRPWDGPWAMRFPDYPPIGERWDGAYEAVARHPSQLYQALGEGLLVFLLVRWLMLSRGWGGGRVAAAFVVAYAAARFVAEFFRLPDEEIGYEWLGMTRGQEFSLAMLVVGLVASWLLRRSRPPSPEAVEAAQARTAGGEAS